MRGYSGLGLGVSVMRLPSAISIREVSPRDGLQNEPPISTNAKLELIDALSRTGVRRIETVSFVRPDAVPQMADAEEVWAGIERNPDVTYSALVPNVRGAQRALDAGFTALEVVVSASATHNMRNVNRTVEQSLAEISQVIKLARAAPSPVTVEVIVATSFGCPFEGDIEPNSVASIVERVVADGADRVAFGDTTGMATPRRVVDVVELVRLRRPDVPILLHFHNTRGTALANVLAAMQIGITEFDASVAGLGGCPFAPGASGNVATEELVHMVEDMGVDTGINLDALLDAGRIATRIMGRELPSAILRAGPRTRRYPS